MRRPLFALFALVLFACAVPLFPQEPGPPPSEASPTEPATDQGTAAEVAAPQPDLQAISKSGLLPVYGVEFRFDPAWVDSADFPSQSADFPNFGVNSSFQQVWDSLKQDGFNVLRLPIDVRESKGAANRAANLCQWAKNNDARLVLELTASDSGQRVPADYSAKVVAFVKALLTRLRTDQDKNLQSYLQIMSYQLENEINHAGLHGGMSSSAAEPLVLKAAQELRKIEIENLNGTGLQATPLMISASFDYELIGAQAIANVPLTDNAYNQAYKSLTQVLAGPAHAAEVDLISVDWFAGSVSAGGVEKFPDLLRSLVGDLPAKQLVFTTGFSAAFQTTDEQKRLFSLAFANLGDYRASSGASSPFVGVLFRDAINAKDANPKPPRPGLPDEMAKWDWPARAQDLWQMWTKNKKSPEMSWWLKKVEDNMGLLALNADQSGNQIVSAEPAQQALTQIADAVSDASMAPPAGAPAAPGNAFAAPPGDAFAPPPSDAFAPPPGDSAFAAPPGVPGSALPGSVGSAFTQTVQGTSQQVLQGLLGRVLDRLGGGMGGAPAGAGFVGDSGYSPSGSGYGTPAAAPGAPSDAYGAPQTGGPSWTPATNPTDSNTYGPPAGGTTTGASGTYGTGPATTPANTVPVIVMASQGVSVDPKSPQVGQPVTISAALTNQSPVDANGLMMFAVGEDNVSLGQTGNLHVSPNSTYRASLQWVPTDLKSSYRINLHLVDGFGNQAANLLLDPISVSAPKGATGSTGASGIGGGATGTPAGTTGVANVLPTVVALPPGAVRFAGLQFGALPYAVAGQPSPVSVSFLNPYAVPLRNVQASLSVDGKPVQTQTLSLLLPQQSRSLVFPGVNLATAGQHDVKILVESQRPGVQPQTGTVSTTIVARPATSTTATGTLAASATASSNPAIRSVTNLAPAGTVGGASRGSLARATTATNLPTAAGPTGVRSIAASAPPTLAKPSVQSAASAGARANAVQTIRPVLPAAGSASTPRAAVQNTPPAAVSAKLGQAPARSVSPPSGSVPTRSVGTPAQSVAAKPMLSAAATAPVGRARLLPDLSVSAAEVRYSPAVPRMGQSATFSATVRNLGNAPAQGATVMFKLFADGRLVASSPPFAFNISPGAIYQATWQAILPRARQLQITVNAVSSQDANPANNQATLNIAARP